MDAGFRELRRRGCDVFLEIGPGRALLNVGRRSDPDRDAVWVPSLRRGHGDWPQILRSLGRLYERGVSVDWHGFDRDYARTRIPVPFYPWQRKRYWLANDDLDERGRAAPKDESAPRATRNPSSFRPPSPVLSIRASFPMKNGNWCLGYSRRSRVALCFRHPPIPTSSSSTKSSGASVSRRPPAASGVSALTAPAVWTVADESGAEDLGPNFETYLRVLDRIEDLCAPCVAAAFRKLGCELRIGTWHTVASLSQRMNVGPKHHGLLRRMAEILADAGCLHRDGDGWRVAAEVEPVDLDQRIALLRAESPDAWAELAIFQRCGAKLAEVLRGEIDPLHLIFPEGDVATATAVYRDSPARTMNGLVHDVVARAIDALPQYRVLRVLEIGAGTGGTTAAILPALPSDQTEYWFTDISPRFTTAASEAFGGYSFMRYHVLNIERSPAGQGFPAEAAFDLVIASNVLHATRDLRQSVSHARELLAPGGYLVLLENTEPGRAVDLTFGLTAGWWQFSDHELRPSHPLISAERWRTLLEASGYCDAESLTLAREPKGALARQSVIVARAAENAGRGRASRKLVDLRRSRGDRSAAGLDE